MKIQVFDIGNSNLKCYIWDVSGESPKLIHDNHTPTSHQMIDNLEIIDNAYKTRDQDAVIILSMSDSVVYENKSGKKIWIPLGEPTHEYARLEQLPPYRETGKPHGEVLSGVFNQLQMIKMMSLAQGFGHTRILPFSTYVAAHLAGEKRFNNWDITHASNSGVYNYQIPNPADARFPKCGWHSCIDDIIDAGWISKEILPCHHQLKTNDGTPVLIGGHDTTFANAMHTPYSTKPYISCGTWLTVSVESSTRPNWVDEGARYIIAPNGAVLKQICVPSPQSQNGKIEVVKRISNFLDKHLVLETASPIRVFGPWRRGMHEMLQKYSEFEFVMMSENYLTEQAALYAARSITK